MTATTGEIDPWRERLGDLTEREVFSLIRRRAGISQRDIARAVGITPSYLSAWETGRWGPPERREQAYWDALDRLLANDA